LPPSSAITAARHNPATTYAYQWWANTTDGLLKLRNGSNSDPWIVVGTLADTNLGLLSLAGGTLTGALLADDSGTAALPAIAFDGDPNTGIFRAGADQFGIATNGVERVEFGTTEVVFNDGGADLTSGSKVTPSQTCSRSTLAWMRCKSPTSTADSLLAPATASSTVICGLIRGIMGGVLARA
jgi:hypothetical protein